MICNDGEGSRNKGDQAILIAMKDSLARQGLEIHTFPHSEMRRIGQWWQFLRSLIKADLFILGGGHLLQDLTSQAFLISSLMKILLARMLTRPVMCYAVGAGPIESLVGRFLASQILNRVNLITVRDEESGRFLRQIGVNKPGIYVTADPAFALKPTSHERVRDILRKEGIEEKEGPLVVIAPRRWFHYHHRVLPMRYGVFRGLRPSYGGQDYERFVRILAGLADYIVSETGAKVIFLPMRIEGRAGEPGQDDDNVCREIMGLMKNEEKATMLQGDYNPQEIMGIIGQMDMVVSVRMHPIIFAAVCGVPFVGLSVYKYKGKGFFHMIGGADRFVYIQEASAETLISLVENTWAARDEISKSLKDSAASLRKRAISNAEWAFKLLQDQGAPSMEKG